MEIMTARWPLFNTEQDNNLIDSGTYFWCHACLIARPKDDQSDNPKLCIRCNDGLKAEKADALSETKDYWTATGIFVHNGKGYITTPECGRACIGDYPPPKVVADTPTAPPDKPQDKPDSVSKIRTRGKLRSAGILKHRQLKKQSRGRPKKPDNYSRITRWRRGKEKQMELPIGS